MMVENETTKDCNRMIFPGTDNVSNVNKLVYTVLM